MRHIILAITNDICSDRRVMRIAESLSANGNRVTIIGRKLKNSPSIPPNLAFATQRMRLIFNKGCAFYAEYNIRLFFYLLFAKYSTITANDLDTLVACYIANKIRGKELIYDSHEYFTQVPELQNRPKVQAFWQKIEDQILPNISRASTVCQSIANIYQQQYGVPFHVIRNLPQRLKKWPIPFLIPEQYTEKKIIVYQGTFNQHRGIEQAIEAMQWVENAILLLVGYGPLEAELKTAAAKLLPDNKIWFAGRVEPSELYRYTILASIGLSIEQDCGLNYRYALPNKLFDYIQCHIPVLVSALPEMESIVNQYQVGEILLENTAQQVAKHLNNLLQNPLALERYKNNCAKAATLLCWEKEVVLLHDLYKNKAQSTNDF